MLNLVLSESGPLCSGTPASLRGVGVGEHWPSSQGTGAESWGLCEWLVGSWVNNVTILVLSFVIQKKKREKKKREMELNEMIPRFFPALTTCEIVATVLCRQSYLILNEYGTLRSTVCARLLSPNEWTIAT